MTTTQSAWTHEFDATYDVPQIPGLQDLSWHNDACPSFGPAQQLTDPNGDTHDLRLWIEHADPTQRETGTERYVVNYQPWSAEPVAGVTVCDDGDLYAGDDLHAALAAFGAAQALIQTALRERA